MTAHVSKIHTNSEYICMFKVQAVTGAIRGQFILPGMSIRTHTHTTHTLTHLLSLTHTTRGQQRSVRPLYWSACRQQTLCWNDDSGKNSQPRCARVQRGTNTLQTSFLFLFVLCLSLLLDTSLRTSMAIFLPFIALTKINAKQSGKSN